MFAVSLTVLMGFSALSIDMARVRLAEAQIQASTDAATLAATVMLRDGFTPDEAADAAYAVAQTYLVDMQQGGLEVSVEIGDWDWRSRTFEGCDCDTQNAVNVRVSRNDRGDAGALRLFFAPMVGGPDELTPSREGVGAMRPREVMFVLDESGGLDAATINAIRDALLTHVIDIFDFGQRDDQVGLTAYAGDFEVVTPLSVLDGDHSPDIIWDWTDLKPCDNGILAWENYYRFFTDVLSEDGDDLYLRARSASGMPGWDENKQLTGDDYETLYELALDWYDCDIDFADPADADGCAWMLSQVLFEVLAEERSPIDSFGFLNGPGQIECAAGNEYVGHYKQFDSNEMIDQVDSPTFGLFPKARLDHGYAPVGRNPGAALQDAVDQLTDPSETDEDAHKIIVMFASGDPLCREESTPNQSACQADFENNLVNAAFEAEDAGIHTYVVVLRDDPSESPVLDTMATGDGVTFYTTNLEDMPVILNDLNGTVPVSLVR
jgi:hypothetical protein